MVLGLNTQAATLADFRQWEPVDACVPKKQWCPIPKAPASRPLLVILAEFTGLDVSHPASFTHPTNPPPYYWDAHKKGLLYHSSGEYEPMVFNQGTQPHTLNGYFHEISNGRFAWTKAGVVKVSLPKEALRANLGDACFAYLLQQVYATGEVDFTAFVGGLDGWGNGLITREDLGILLISNDPSIGWQTEGGLDVTLTGATKIHFNGSMATAHDHEDFGTECHELVHAVGNDVDLYGFPTYGNGRLTIMSYTGVSDPVENPETWHLDPWIKMQFGWTDPRIVEIPSKGSAILPAAQLMDPNAPVILCPRNYYRGGEYFLLEYRTTNCAAGPGYDANVLGYSPDTMQCGGLVIWHVYPRALWSKNQQPVWSESAATNHLDFEARGRCPWPSNTTTPVLRYWDGHASTLVRLHVRPFVPGANSITVDWDQPEVWVDFRRPADVLDEGSSLRPYRTFAAGLNALTANGMLHLVGGTSAEKVTHLTLPLRIDGRPGPATIGH